MRKLVSVLFLVAGFLCISNPVLASSFYASTDMFSYTGSVTRYATLEDARAGVGSIGGPYTIPARATDAPYNTPSRDAGIYFVNNAPSYAAANQNIFLTAYLVLHDDATNGAYSGWGNPNNNEHGLRPALRLGRRHVDRFERQFQRLGRHLLHPVQHGRPGPERHL